MLAFLQVFEKWIGGWPRIYKFKTWPPYSVARSFTDTVIAENNQTMNILTPNLQKSEVLKHPTVV